MRCLSPRAPKLPGSKQHGKWMIWTEDYPFTGFLQIWRSVSCVIACISSIRAALIFFLFAVLIIFISRRFPWLLGGFLKWSMTKLGSKTSALDTARHVRALCGMLSDHEAPLLRWILGEDMWGEKCFSGEAVAVNKAKGGSLRSAQVGSTTDCKTGTVTGDGY